MRFRRILFVDDEPNFLSGVKRMLHQYRSVWDMRFARSVDDALAQLRQEEFETVVADISMPGKDGFELLVTIRMDPELSDIPVIMVTGLDERTLKLGALELGATDLLNKPVQREELLARIRSALLLKSHHDQIRAQNATLERSVAERTRDLADSRLDLIWCLARAAEQRDGTTGRHIIRVAAYSRAIAARMGLDREFVATLTLASPLHDVGKIGIPDHILKKRGPFTDAEREVMQRHCAIGAEILTPHPGSTELGRIWQGATNRSTDDDGADTAAPSVNPLLQMAAMVARTHHERWNGSGYPDGLAGDAIPLASHIVAVADVYDVLRSARPYKPAFAEERVLAMIRDQVGRHFDPEVYAAFERSLDELSAIAGELADSAGDELAAAA